jgi:hypothetical protein
MGEFIDQKQFTGNLYEQIEIISPDFPSKNFKYPRY